MDITNIPAVLSGLKAAIDITKMLKDSNLSLEKAEIKLKFAELTEILADTKMHLAEIQELISDKDKKIKELEENLEIKGKLKWEQPVYYLVDGNAKDGPYCPQCYDKEKKLIRLQQHEPGSFECKTCKNFFFDKGYYPSIKSIDNPNYD